MRLLLATRNEGKKAEYAELLQGLELELTTLLEEGIIEDVVEDGETFADNALLKARTYADISGLLTLADDSGLEVDALGGAPGVYSARYGGETSSDEDRYNLLLHNLRSATAGERTARFICVIALAWPGGRAKMFEGSIEGRITREPRGMHGFGYDPVFLVPEYGRTMAQLLPEVKNRISHRARAAAKLLPVLAGIVAQAAAEEGETDGDQDT
jgi:XTP/dITP diphosphohydrolase